MVVTSYSKSLIFNCVRVWEYARKTEQLRGLEQYLHQRRVKYTYAIYRFELEFRQS